MEEGNQQLHKIKLRIGECIHVKLRRNRTPLDLKQKHSLRIIKTCRRDKRTISSPGSGQKVINDYVFIDLSEGAVWACHYVILFCNLLCTVYCYFSSAFNTMLSHLLTRKLLNMDVPHQLVKLTLDFLTNRNQFLI